MSQSLAVRNTTVQPGTHERPAILDPRRKLQLALAAIWLLDGMLQFQPVMFGYVVRVTDRLTARPCLTPRCAALGKVAMGLTMGYMLV